ncbi:MAG TPA: FMN-binding negative transcriptional regulator [Candidatus Aquilonibacter sp.]|nr:FMN-binding negative transcriptional regulator [Candidatus Aquilonibacter sp.]
MTYRPPYFRMDDRSTLLELIARHPFASLIGTDSNGITITHMPLFAVQTQETVRLQGHIARANVQWRTTGQRVVATFTVANHYISPSWYPSKQHDPRTVPTWDYVAVHARGSVRFIHDRVWLRDLVARSSEIQERSVGGSWSIDDAPPDYLESQLRGIVGVELDVEDLSGIFKLNQNHPPENVACVVDALVALGTPGATALASWMKDART